MKLTSSNRLVKRMGVLKRLTFVSLVYRLAAEGRLPGRRPAEAAAEPPPKEAAATDAYG